MVFSSSRSGAVLDRPRRKTRHTPVILDGLESRVLLSTVMATFEGQIPTITANDVTIPYYVMWQPTQAEINAFVTAWNTNWATSFTASWVGDFSSGSVGDSYYFPGITDNGWQPGNDNPLSGPLAATLNGSSWTVSLPASSAWDDGNFYGVSDDLTISGNSSGFATTTQQWHVYGDVMTGGNIFGVDVVVNVDTKLAVQEETIKPTITLTQQQQQAGHTWDAASQTLTINGPATIDVSYLIKQGEDAAPDRSLGDKYDKQPAHNLGDPPLVPPLTSYQNKSNAQGVLTGTITVTGQTTPGTYKLRVYDLANQDAVTFITIVVIQPN